MSTSNCYNKHLSLSKRILIEKGLDEGKNFIEIAEMIGKSNRTISYEVRKHREKKQGLKITEKTIIDCPLTHKPPYVCNACPKYNHCRKTKYIYSAENANMNYKEKLRISRTGIDLTNEEFIKLNRIITEDIKKGHSFYMICKNHKDSITLTPRTLYNYVEKEYLDIINLDLPRKVRYKKRNRDNTKNTKTKKDLSHRLNRTYDDFKKYINENKYLYIVEMDTVEGIKGENESVLLTLLWRKSNLLLAIKLEHKTSECVNKVFEEIKESLGMELFHRYFPIILTDNGSEFSNPENIEDNGPDVINSKVFYCDPKHSEQKGKIEVAHEYIRRFIPKGISFNKYTQDDINIMINNINNTPRKSLDNDVFDDYLNTPLKIQRTFVEKIFFDFFDLYYIEPKEIKLNKSIFQKKDNLNN